MTGAVSGAGGPRQPDSRFPSSHRTFRILPGCSRTRGRSENQRRQKTITLEMRDVPVIDQPRWPALHSMATTARMTLKMVWKSTPELVHYESPSQQFRFTRHRAECQLEARIEAPSRGFSWKSDPLNTSRANFAVIGEELSGRYYPDMTLKSPFEPIYFI